MSARIRPTAPHAVLLEPSANVAPARPRTSSQPESSRYQVTAAQQQRLASGDLAGFWKARLGLDPMARTGVAIWGGADHLDRLLDSADEATLQQYWIPKLNWPSRLILLAITGRSAPKTKEAARAHWHWMGETARDRLMTAIKHHSPSANPEDVFRAIGFALAKEHVWSIADDTANTRGTVSGLLSDTQIAENHHRVLKAFGLPEKAFGGTPFRILPDAFELWLSADLYHHDGDK